MGHTIDRCITPFAMYRHERSFHFALKMVRDETPFCLYKVTSPFCPTSSFSNVTFDLATHVDTEDTEGRRVALHFYSLFNVDVKPFRETLELKTPMATKCSGSHVQAKGKISCVQYSLKYSCASM